LKEDIMGLDEWVKFGIQRKFGSGDMGPKVSKMGKFGVFGVFLTNA